MPRWHLTGVEGLQRALALGFRICWRPMVCYDRFPVGRLVRSFIVQDKDPISGEATTAVVSQAACAFRSLEIALSILASASQSLHTKRAKMNSRLTASFRSLQLTYPRESPGTPTIVLTSKQKALPQARAMMREWKELGFRVAVKQRGSSTN